MSQDMCKLRGGDCGVMSMPAEPPLLTPGLIRALASLIHNSPSRRTAEAVQIDGARHARALAS